MRKIVLGFLVLMASIVFVGCNKNDFFAKAKLENIENGTTSLEFSLKLEDPNKQLEGTIYLKLLKGEVLIKETSKTLADLEESSKIEFNNLTIDTTYNLVITTTFNSKSRNLLTQEIKTIKNSTFEVTTAEEFLNIKNDIYATYKIMNDIDFKDITKETFNEHHNSFSRFRGKIEGNNNSLLNYKFEGNNSNAGIFRSLEQGASIKDLVIDNFVMTATNVTGSKYAGVLFGQNSSSEVTIDNITIKNSKINLEIDSNSDYIRVGLLGGTSAATISNVTSEHTNLINVSFKRIGKILLGGLLGTTSENASIKNSKVATNLKLSVNQTKEKGLNGSKKAVIRVGGVVGEAMQGSFSDIISNSNIDLEKLDFSVSEISETNKERLYVEISVGGLFAVLGRKITNAVSYGNINIASYSYINELPNKEKMVYQYQGILYIGGLIGYTELASTSLLNIVRADGSLVILEQSAISRINLGIDTLFGYAKNVSFDSKNHGLLAKATSVYNNTEIVNKSKLIENLLEYFNSNEWIKKNLIK